MKPGNRPFDEDWCQFLQKQAVLLLKNERPGSFDFTGLF